MRDAPGAFWRAWRRLCFELVVRPFDLDDGTGDGSPSLSKMLAWLAFTVAAIAILKKLEVSGTQVTLIVIAITAAFGRSMWKQWLARGTWAFNASDSTSRTTTIIRQEIAERRKQGDEDGTEPTA
jgi:hypothetical protein